MLVILALSKLREEDLECDASLGYIMRLHFFKKKPAIKIFATALYYLTEARKGRINLECSLSFLNVFLIMYMCAKRTSDSLGV